MSYIEPRGPNDNRERASNQPSICHQQARKLAAAGVPVIPIGPDKRPVGWLVPKGIDDETTSLATIDRWWAEGDWNYGYRPTNLPQPCVVIDVDLSKTDG